jgi:hypothetical protein
MVKRSVSLSFFCLIGMMIEGRERSRTKRERPRRRKTKAGEMVTAGMIEKISCRG